LIGGSIIYNKNKEKQYNLWGWLLFLVCAVFFIASAIVSGDILYLIGSIIFLVACIVFIIPLVVDRGRDEKD